MIFSESVQKTTETRLAALLEKAGAVKRQEILSCLARAAEEETEDTVFAARWILANSPLSDLANYDFRLFLSCARHGVFLRQHSPYAKDIPEDIFLNYVLHIRVNEEELCDCREQFYRELRDRVSGLSAHDAILETNYWNAEHVMYQATSQRTISALGAYRSGYGRCGEESNFGVNALRSIGIPTRQIYTPRWAHCDSNHAWVEVYCDGMWHFLGACEPEEVLNKGWFTNASSRAILIHSRCFGDISGEEVISKVGMATFLNNLKLYAVTKRLTVSVTDESGRPVEGAEVIFGILNYCDIFPAAVIKTDASGRCGLTCGLGSINIHVKKDGVFCERTVFTPETDTVEIVLRTDRIVCNQWEDFRMIAPRDRIVSGNKPTEEQKERCAEKTAAANARREARVAAMFDREKAERLVKQYGYSRKIYDLLFESRGNADRLMEFLGDETFAPAEKEALLLTLSQKDRRDVAPEILKEALTLTRGYTAPKKELFYPYIVCPRVFHEPLTRNRQFILDYFTDEEKSRFRADPRTVWSYIEAQIGFDESVEYGQIVTCPVGALTVKNANPLAKKILFVSICRALGIASRMNPVDQMAEYYEGDRFVPVEKVLPGSCTVLFEKGSRESWSYGPDFGIARLVDGNYQHLNLWNSTWDGNEMRISVNPGDYRVITDNRLPNGDLHASRYHFHLEDGETVTVRLHRYEADLSEMLDHFALDEFKVRDGDGHVVLGSELTRKKAVLMWLDEGMEPTEHILNEMLEQAADFRALPADLVFMFRNKAALENAKVQKVLQTFPDIRICYDSFVPNVETLARRMYVDPEKLPLILVTTNELNAIYACSGYNAGSGVMIVRICSEF